MVRRGTITMVIPSYNHEQYIDECLESVLEQERAADEIIVVDDGSTDGTVSRLRKFQGRMRVELGDHVGLRPNVGRGLALATGDYVWILASDDRLEPDALQVLGEVLDRNSEVGLAYGHVAEIGQVGLATPVPERPMGLQLDPRPLISRNFIPAPATLCRRQALTDTRQPQQTLCGDWEWWLALMLEGWAIYGAPRIVAGHRRHGGSLSSHAGTRRQIMAEIDMLSSLKEWQGARDPHVDEAFRSAISHRFTQLGWHNLQGGDRDGAVDAFQSARWGTRPPLAYIAGATFARWPGLYRMWRRVRPLPT